MFQGADQHCTVGLLSKMAVDRLNQFLNIHANSHLAPNNLLSASLSWQDIELKPCWCPRSFHQCVCRCDWAVETGKQHDLDLCEASMLKYNEIWYGHEMKMQFFLVWLFQQFSGSMHQPAWGAALLLRPQASPPPCSRCPQVASFQVCLETTSAL